VHDVAFVVLHVRLTVEPDTTLVALAARVSVGAGGVVVPPVPPVPVLVPLDVPAPRGTIAQTA